jgi:hypothetical protein
MMSAAAISPGTRSTVLELQRLVRTTRRRLRWSWLAAGACLLIGLVAAALLIAVAVDLAFVLPDVGRWVAFLVAATIGLLVFLSRVLRPTLTRLPAPGVALRIERRTENMHNRLLTVLDLADRPLDGESATFFDAVVMQTSERVRGFDPRTVVDQQSLARAVRWGMVPTALLVAAAVIWPHFVGVALQRVLQPWADIPPPSLLTFHVQPGDSQALFGDSVPLVVAIDGGEPEEIRLKLTSASGERTVSVKRGEDGYRYTLEKFTEPLAYRVYAGRTWTKQYQLDLVKRPILDSVRLRIHPPKYIKNAAIKEVRAEERTIDALEGSEIEAIAQGSGEIAEAEIVRERRRQENRFIVDDRTTRWLVQDAVPQGSWEFGNWNWDWSQKFRRTHGEPAQNHETRHGLGINPPVVIRADDVFVTYVLVDPMKIPNQILIEMNDGNTWEHRAYWGVNKLNKSGKDEAPANLRLGEMPKPGEWVRLEIPAKAIGVAGKTIRELAFCTFGGGVRWDWLGVAAARNDPLNYLEKLPEIKLAETNDGWNGRVPVEGPGIFHVELRDTGGRTNANPDYYAIRAIPDMPPTARLMTPGRDVVVSTPTPIDLMASVADDVGLAKAELLLVRTRERKEIAKTIWSANGTKLLERIRAKAVLAELDAKPGDEIKYRVRVHDLKVQTGLSDEFKITIAPNEKNAHDKMHDRFAEQRSKLTEKIQQLTKREEKIADKTAEIAKKYEPPAAEKPPEPRPHEKNADAAKDSPREKKDPAKDTDAKNAPSKLNEKSAEPKKQETNPPANQKFSQEERKDLKKLAQEQNDVRGKVDQAARELKQLLTSPEAQTATAPELRALDDAARDLERNAVPDAKTAMQDLTYAANTNHDSKNAKPAAESTETTKKDLQRALAAMERSKNANQSDDPEAAEAADNDSAAVDAAEQLDAARERMERLKDEVGKEQEQQEKLSIAEDNATNDKELKSVDNRQRELESRAKETLKDVQDALGGAPPRDLSRENRPEEGDPDAQKPSEGMPQDKQDQGDGKDDQGQPKGASDKDSVPTPDGEGQKQGEGKPGDSKDGKKNGQGKSGQDGKQGKDGVPEFETLNKAANQRGKGGKQGGDLRKDVQGRQQMLTRDLNKAAKALDGKSGEFEQTLDQLKKSLGDGQKSSKLLSDPNVQKQLDLAQKMQRSDSKSKSGRPNGKGTNGLVDRWMPAGPAGDPSHSSLTEDIASMKLQPRDREELIQGAKAPTPESYKPFVRDYYNRLSETKPKQ